MPTLILLITAISTTSLHKDEPQVGNVVVVKYATKKRALTYLGIVQSVTEEDKCHIQYLKRSGGKTFSLKEVDIDSRCKQFFGSFNKLFC